MRQRAPRPFYLVVEKILARHETLRDDWPVEGTTGYEFANLVTGLLIDPAGEAAFSGIYAEFAETEVSFNEIVRDCKIRIMENEMASELKSTKKKSSTNMWASGARMAASTSPPKLIQAHTGPKC